MEEQVDWATHLSAIEAEGISVQAYARREALSAASLYYWRRRLKAQAAVPADPAVAQLVAVQLPEPPHIGQRCTLWLAPGVRLAGVRPFQNLSETVLRQLSQGTTVHLHDVGDLLFREGDAAGAYLLVETGDVEVFRYSHSGEERVFQVFEAGRTVAEAAMFMPHGRYPMCARARTACRVYRLRRDSLLAACSSHSELAMDMLAMLSHALYMQVNKVDWISSSSASERLANYLLGLKVGERDTVQLPLSQRQLAAHLGIRAETLSRLFTDWQARGYVAGRRNEWELRDKAYLNALASPAQRSF